jgi:hypothetical protein
MYGSLTGFVKSLSAKGQEWFCQNRKAPSANIFFLAEA